MSFETVRETVVTEFLDNWNTTTTPVKFDNLDAYIKGTGAVESIVDGGLTEFVHFYIRENEVEQADIGATNPRIRRRGRIIAQLFIQEGNGTDRLRQLADLFSPIFQRKQFPGIQFRSAKLVDVGPEGNEGFYQMNVIIDYYRDNIGF